MSFTNRTFLVTGPVGKASQLSGGNGPPLGECALLFALANESADKFSAGDKAAQASKAEPSHKDLRRNFFMAQVSALFGPDATGIVAENQSPQQCGLILILEQRWPNSEGQPPFLYKNQIDSHVRVRVCKLGSDLHLSFVENFCGTNQGHDYYLK